MIIYRDGRRIKTGGKFRSAVRLAQLRNERIASGIASLESELEETERAEITRLAAIAAHRRQRV